MLKHINENNFKEEVELNNKVILVDFFATWCPPCKMLSPVVEKIGNSTNEFDVGKLDIDESQTLAMQYKVNVVPTMIIFKAGKEVERMEGYLDESTILSKVRNHLS